ncbi:DUF4268 domain-containing protein [Maritimibacter dapengensis]|uniref:DUF4268 domain-containing protein n=1 Tax=Maritimibacter dapengensis TaxID=2836868 RepID=A0ABS6SWN4_9RHOB|nr:DUF4268 domain-containing protein [Maritimibacter dapengensis]MBV7377368.1 DUF4268 domain-containing protein [Maritimibacter dapengensis]
MTELGRLERVDLRDIWRTEAQDFTPWLAREDNLALLSETLAIELELEAVERNVGPFRADILCKDTSSDNWVLVENQLERTDHTHLGQLMTYAAGLDAVTIVWIAAKIADEHRAAMDWLNEITKSEVRFFALEVELWKIGDSHAAPKFNVVSSPNDWSRSSAQGRQAIETGELSDTRQLQLDYWTGVQDEIARRAGRLSPVKPLPATWTSHGIGKTGVNLNASLNIREKWVRVEIYTTGKWAKPFFHQLSTSRHEIDALIPGLEWQEMPDKLDSRICLSTPADINDVSDWPRQHNWLVDKMLTFDEVFRPYVSKLLKEDLGSEST